MSDREAKEKIMTAVRELLAEGCPVGDVTVRKIAQKAGVGIGTVSYHFHSKDKLVYEVIAGQMTELAGGLSPGRGEGTPFERLRQFFHQTAELALQYTEIFRAQLSYEIVNGDMSLCYYITPLLKEHFGGTKSDLEIKIIALQMITAMQVILLKMEEFRRYAGVNIRDEKQREEAIDVILDMAIKPQKGGLS
ncbi:MAG TPA: TetR/AcrR family transcriptional regulator [Anaerovoracaceae bacterium]|nr:TetR/AcrR family transcriptional regulator [Anaerovoracaceae bacterium]